MWKFAYVFAKHLQGTSIFCFPRLQKKREAGAENKDIWHPEVVSDRIQSLIRESESIWSTEFSGYRKLKWLSLRYSPGYHELEWLSPRESPGYQKLKWLSPRESQGYTMRWNDLSIRESQGHWKLKWQMTGILTTFGTFGRSSDHTPVVVAFDSEQWPKSRTPGSPMAKTGYPLPR